MDVQISDLFLSRLVKKKDNVSGTNEKTYPTKRVPAVKSSTQVGASFWGLGICDIFPRKVIGIFN